MANFNKVFLMGNLTRDPEIRYLESGTALCKFGMAINHSYRTQDGQQREEVCFVDVTAWGRRGEVISEYFSKGKPIFIEGRLRFDQWEDQSGQRRSRLEVVMENFEFIGGRGDSGGDGGYQRQNSPPPQRRQAPPQQPQGPPPPQDPPPPQAPPSDGPPPGNDGPPADDFDIQDEKIPF